MFWAPDNDKASLLHLFISITIYSVEPLCHTIDVVSRIVCHLENLCFFANIMHVVLLSCFMPETYPRAG